MDKRIGQDIPSGPERRAFLADNADVLVEIHYHRHLSKEEKNEKLHYLVSLNKELIDAEAKKKATVAAMGEEIKNIKQNIDQLVDELESGTVPAYGTCYKIFEGDEVGIYDGDGYLVSVRPPTQQERQQTIFAELRRSGS